MKEKVVKSIGLVFILSLVAKVIGFLKTIIQASFFGANYTTDAFNIANGIASNILFMFTTAISVALLPTYIRKKNSSSVEELKVFCSKVITILLCGTVFVMVVLEIGAPVIVRLAAPAYQGLIFEQTVKFLRILLTGYVFSLLASLYQNLLNAESIYGSTSISSIINSIVLVVVIVSLADLIGVWSLVIAVPVSFLIQFIVLYVKGRKFGKISLKNCKWDSDIKNLLIQSLPILLSQATVEINQVVDKALLSTVEEGAVTAVSYAAVLYQFVSGILNVPLSSVLYTELSEAVSKKDFEYLKKILNKTYQFAVVIGIPIILVVFVCSHEIVSIVFGHGKFSSEAIMQTQEGLLAYILCIIPTTVKSVLTRAYYSFYDTKRPMLISIGEVIVNIVLSFLLVKPYGILGVVGATAISSYVFMIVLMINFNSKHVSIFERHSLREYLKEIIACGLTVLISFLVKGIIIPNIYLSLLLKAFLLFCYFFIILILLRDQLVVTAIKNINWRRK